MILRAAEPRDALEVARVHITSWQAAYRGLVPDEYLDQLNIEDRAARYDFSGADLSKPLTIVALKEASIVGFVTTLPSRSADLPEDGEIGGLYVSPQYWGHRAGAALIAAGREQLARLGFAYAHLWVLENNTRAERFYEMDGWRRDGARQIDTSRGFPLTEIRYRRRLAPA